MIIEVDFKALGKLIREYRNRAHLSQEKLAELINRTPQFVGNIERGVSTPSVSTLMNLAVALKITPSELFSDSIARIYQEDEHMLRDNAAGFFNTLSEKLCPRQRFAEPDATYPEAEGLPAFFLLLDVDKETFFRA